MCYTDTGIHKQYVYQVRGNGGCSIGDIHYYPGSFDLTNMDLGVISPTDKPFAAKREKTKVTAKENKITAWDVEPTQGAGLMAILSQLDVKPAL